MRRKRIKNLEITAIALVAKPANKRKFLLFKSEKGEEMPYSGVDDKGLPENVKALSEEKRETWVKVFNEAWKGYKKEDDKKYDPDKTLEQNKERYCFAVANYAVGQMKSEEEGGKDMPEEEEKKEEEKAEDATKTISPDALEEVVTSLNNAVKKLTDLLEKTKPDEKTEKDKDETEDKSEVEKKGAVLNSANKRLIKQVIDNLQKLLASAGVEKTPESPKLKKEEIEELLKAIEKLPSKGRIGALLHSALKSKEDIINA